jgi:hypothetical protein
MMIISQFNPLVMHIINMQYNEMYFRDTDHGAVDMNEVLLERIYG